jgi:PKD repeat protein
VTRAYITSVLTVVSLALVLAGDAMATPTASFTVGPAGPLVAPQEVTFTSTSTAGVGNIINTEWDLDGDGTFEASGTQVTRTFTDAGTFDVTLRVTDEDTVNPATAQVTQEIDVEEPPPPVPPVANFSWSPNLPAVGVPATFTSTSSTVDGETITSFEWHFDNDNVIDATGPIAQHTFTDDGTHEVRLVVEDSRGLTDELVRDVDVPAPVPPAANFFWSPNPPTVGVPATFTSNSTTVDGQTITSFEWHFDNDNVIDATGPIAQHTFTEDGTHDVRLVVRDSRGLTDELVRDVAVPPPVPPAANFFWSPNPPTVGETATFTSTSSTVPGQSITSVQWDFDNNNTIDATGPTAQHTFATAGTHEVRLVVVDSRGLTDELVRDVVAISATLPTAAFSVSPNPPTVGETATFTSTSSTVPGQSIVSYQWDFENDGSIESTQQNPTHAFATAGSHEVRLVVQDSRGLADEFVRDVVVIAPPPMPPANSPPASTPAPATLPQPVVANASPSLRLMSPFPVVRLAGAVVQKGTRIRRLTVRAPKGSRVLVFCRGRRCPTKRLTKLADRGTLRFRAFERLVPAGSLVQVFVRRGEQIGKYTSFRIRRKRVPKRIDGCLLPSSTRAVTCPEE